MKTITKLILLASLALIMAACQPPAGPEAVTPEAATPEAVTPEAVTPEAVTPEAATPEAATPEAATPEAATPEAAAPAVAMSGGVTDLAGTSWIMSSVDGNLPVADTTVTLQFGAGGRVSGSDGCNQFSTTYTQDGASLTINQPAAGTMMMCPEPVMDQAAAYMTALAETTSFTATSRQLILHAGDEIAATFVIEAQELADSTWEVINYNNGREAVVGLLPDTEITANFGVGGELTGNAGCNEYFTSYAVNGNAIEIGTPGTTFRFCPEPEGVMDQEFEFLNALQSAATYSIQANMLQMRTAADQLALVMVRRIVVDLPEPPPEPATPTGRVSGTQGLNVRSGPGTNFPVIGLARAGDEGEIIGRSADGRWWAVSVPSAPGGIGWVSVDFVLATNAEDVPVIAAPPPPPPTPTRVPPPPTPTPLPAATATPSAEISLWADRTNISQGQCATLNWSVNNVQAVWVYPRGEPYSRFPRTGQGSEVVCPNTTTTYEMRVLQRDGSTVFREVTIHVAVPQPTATPAPAPDPLRGTRWEVINFNNGAAITTLIPDTRITMDFGTDGQVTGNAGCNSYFGPYQASGNSITISQLGGTTRFCADPAGVMDQEAQFLSRLPSATNLRIDGNRLELTSAGGQIVVVANRAP